MFRRIVGVGVAVFSIAFLAVFLPGPTLYALGESYTWHDYSEIAARGGGYNEFIASEPLLGPPFVFTQDASNPAVFTAEPNTDDCKGKLILTFSSSVKSQAAITGENCPLVGDLSRTVTVDGNSVMQTRIQADSDTMQRIYVTRECASQSSDETVVQACSDSADERYDQIAAECRSEFDAVDYPHLANSYLDCLAEKLEVDRPGQGVDVEAEGGADVTCAIKNIGWIVCQSMQILAWITDSAFGLLSIFLEVDPLQQQVNTQAATGNQQSDTPLYSAWKVALGFANVVFVFVFIFIIFSYITNQGLNAYNIKTIGPRLIIASLLVNLSFFICGIAVDLSNILGGTLRSTLVDMSPPRTNTSYQTWTELTESIMAITPTDQAYNEKNNPTKTDDEDPAPGAAAPPDPKEEKADPEISPVATEALLVGGTLVGGAVLIANLSVLVPFLVAVLAALVTVLILLIVRHAVIICLVMISPLAFAMILLPNTKKWFDRWADIFTKFLILYPAISLIFGASYFASNVVTLQADQHSQSFLAIFALGIQLIPLFITPLVLKLSGGLLDRFAGIVNNPNKGPLDRLKKSAGAFREDRKNLQQGRAAKMGSFTPTPGKRNFLKNGIGRVKHAAKNPSAAYQRRKMRSDAADSAASGNLKTAKESAFGTDRAIESAAKGIKEGEFRDALLDESAAYTSKHLDEVTTARVKAQLAEFKSRRGDDRVSHQDALTMASTGKDKNGRALSDIEQAAAMQMAASTATSGEAHALIAESGHKNELVRRALADTLRERKFSQENTHFGGAALNRVVEGDFKSQADVDKLIVGAAAGSKYGANTLSNQSSYTISRLNHLMSQSPADSGMSAAVAAKLKQTARTALSTPSTASNIKSTSGPGEASARQGIERMAL